MDQTQIAILSLIIVAIGEIKALLIALFPKLFPAIGTFLISLNRYVWIIILLLLIIAGQQIFIYIKVIHI
ncbi:hypothetical protein [Bacillus halotolerans]|uniref:hypothetical protein n=1 Tax=Bacillus halotolerans TaxID=260554 RepID=UPI00257343B4|nr:hypothetical protein [Bacillus halotolerans]MDL5612105.1 hypothetical protein [Bacillus halotolerans]